MNRNRRPLATALMLGATIAWGTASTAATTPGGVSESALAIQRSGDVVQDMQRLMRLTSAEWRALTIGDLGEAWWLIHDAGEIDRSRFGDHTIAVRVQGRVGYIDTERLSDPSGGMLIPYVLTDLYQSHPRGNFSILVSGEQPPSRPLGDPLRWRGFVWEGLEPPDKRVGNVFDDVAVMRRADIAYNATNGFTRQGLAVAAVPPPASESPESAAPDRAPPGRASPGGASLDGAPLERARNDAAATAPAPVSAAVPKGPPPQPRPLRAITSRGIVPVSKPPAPAPKVPAAASVPTPSEAGAPPENPTPDDARAPATAASEAVDRAALAAATPVLNRPAEASDGVPRVTVLPRIAATVPAGAASREGGSTSEERKLHRVTRVNTLLRRRVAYLEALLLGPELGRSIDLDAHVGSLVDVIMQGKDSPQRNVFLRVNVGDRSKVGRIVSASRYPIYSITSASRGAHQIFMDIEVRGPDGSTIFKSGAPGGTATAAVVPDSPVQYRHVNQSMTLRDLGVSEAVWWPVPTRSRERGG